MKKTNATHSVCILCLYEWRVTNFKMAIEKEHYIHIILYVYDYDRRNGKTNALSTINPNVVSTGNSFSLSKMPIEIGHLSFFFFFHFHFILLFGFVDRFNGMHLENYPCLKLSCCIHACMHSRCSRTMMGTE